jgi:hypothetical protein
MIEPRPFVSVRLLMAFAGLAPLGGALRADPAVVFVARDLDTTQTFEAPAPADPERPDEKLPPVAVPRSSAVERAAHGRLLHRDSEGTVHTLIDSRAQGATSLTPIDVTDPDVSYDGRRVVFSGYSQAEGGWRIYEVGIDGTGLRQLTRDDREVDLERYGEASAALDGFDDLDPCYLPDGRICFVSTRAPGVAPDNRLRATNLYVVSEEGTGLHRITSERFGADTPTVDPSSGQIVYSRWWRTGQIEEPGTAAGGPAAIQVDTVPPGSPGYEDQPGDAVSRVLGIPVSSPSPLRSIDESEFPGVNSWFLASVNPDGTDMAMFSGFRLSRELTQAYRPVFLSSGAVLGLFIPKTPFIGFPRGYGLRLFREGAFAPEALGGPQAFPGSTIPFARELEGIVRTVPASEIQSFAFVFSSAAPLGGGRILVSAAREETKQYGLYELERASGRMLPLLDDPSVAELDATPAAPRLLPPVIPDRVPGIMEEDAPRTVEEAFANGSFTFLVENIHFNAPVNAPIVSAPPVGKRLAIEFYMAPQRTSAQAADPPILVRREEIPPSGRVEVELPAGVSLFEVLRQPDGSLAQGRDNQIFHVGGMNFSRAGETGRCVGCHAGHSMMAVPDDSTDLTFTNLAPSAVVNAEPLFHFPAPTSLGGPRDGDGMDPVVGAPEGDQIPLPDLFPPHHLVDRRSDILAEWVGAPGVDNTLTFRWSVPLEARAVVIHAPGSLGGPQGGVFGGRAQRIERLTLTTSLAGSVQQVVEVRRGIGQESEQHKVGLDHTLAFDTLVVSILNADMIGSFEGHGPSLAEVEVIARVSEAHGAAPTFAFLRGDADCDRATNLTDAVTVLNSLFAAAGALCCEAAADANDDSQLNITDPVVLLNYLFLQGTPPAHPSEECGRVAAGSLLCDFEACP